MILGIPLWTTGAWHLLFSAGPDAVSSASVILDQPSGEYYVLMNRDLHTDEDKLNDWALFFTGGDIMYIFEDIACSVSYSDPAGTELAESFRSKLPENQMQLKMEDGTLMLSRMDNGLYDVIIVSKEYAELEHITDSPADNMMIIKVVSES